MDDHDAPLTAEEQKLKQYFEDEDSGKIPFEPLVFPDLVPLPTEEDDVVAEIIPFEKQHGS